jgi:hypothetical protein
MQGEQLRFKSELIDKDYQIDQLMQTLGDKGEETGQLCEQLIDLKNHMLDLQIFHETWHVSMVPLTGNGAQSPMQQST